MNMKEKKSIPDAIVYLCGNAVNGTKPALQKIEGISLEELFEAAKKHMLSAIVGMALESAGLKTKCFSQAIAMAQMKNILLDTHRKQVLTALEAAGVWYMPLKGSVIKEMYPRYGMREMADNDILVDPQKRAQVKDIMEDLGFTTEEYNLENHDAFFKEPVCNFEMHSRLFNSRTKKQILRYYRDVKDRLIKDEENSFGYHFAPEDFYIYMIAHEYRHYVQGGTGLRSLLDTFVFLKQKEKELDWDYIRRETQKLEIGEFEEENRMLAMHLFEEKQLTRSEQSMLDYMFGSNAFGTLANDVNNQILERGRLGFFFSRLFPSYQYMAGSFPAMRKAPFLYPVFWVCRLMSKFVTKHEKFMFELKAALGAWKP